MGAGRTPNPPGPRERRCTASAEAASYQARPAHLLYIIFRILFKGYTHIITLPSFKGLDQGGHFALIVAAGGGHIEVVKLLLDKGADVNQATKVSVRACARVRVCVFYFWKNLSWPYHTHALAHIPALCVSNSPFSLTEILIDIGSDGYGRAEWLMGYMYR